MLTKRTSGLVNAVRDALVKSLYRVPIPMTTSASVAKCVCSSGAGGPYRPDGLWMVVDQ